MASVFVGNINWRCSEQQLGDYFAKFGNVNSVKIITDYETGRSKVDFWGRFFLNFFFDFFA